MGEQEETHKNNKTHNYVLKVKYLVRRKAFGFLSKKMNFFIFFRLASLICSQRVKKKCFLTENNPNPLTLSSLWFSHFCVFFFFLISLSPSSLSKNLPKKFLSQFFFLAFQIFFQKNKIDFFLPNLFIFFLIFFSTGLLLPKRIKVIYYVKILKERYKWERQGEREERLECERVWERGRWEEGRRRNKNILILF